MLHRAKLVIEGEHFSKFVIPLLDLRDESSVWNHHSDHMDQVFRKLLTTGIKWAHSDATAELVHAVVSEVTLELAVLIEDGDDLLPRQKECRVRYG